MVNTDMIDEQRALIMDLLGLAAVGVPDVIGQAAALITAATVIIEREVGTAMAPAALMVLVQPTLAGWRAHAPARCASDAAPWVLPRLWVNTGGKGPKGG